ncbi:hypothetical protein BH10PAT3_BH10PAT3_8290 [soil metagenome]
MARFWEVVSLGFEPVGINCQWQFMFSYGGSALFSGAEQVLCHANPGGGTNLSVFLIFSRVIFRTYRFRTNGIIDIMKKNTHVLKRGFKTKHANTHLVQSYKTTNDSIEPLAEFIGAGLKGGEVCVIVATKPHVDSLNLQLKAMGIDVELEIATGKYQIYNAATVLEKFMVKGMPDSEKFFEVVGGLVAKASAGGTHVRAYGEMVALLWKVGNKEAVMKLENLWDELPEQHTFSLYCSYPDLHFVMDKDAKAEITDCHTAMLPRLAFS